MEHNYAEKSHFLPRFDVLIIPHRRRSVTKELKSRWIEPEKHPLTLFITFFLIRSEDSVTIEGNLTEYLLVVVG